MHLSARKIHYPPSFYVEFCFSQCYHDLVEICIYWGLTLDKLLIICDIVLADCGYSSPRNIIQKCIKDLRLPVSLVYPFIKLGARLFGHFDLDRENYDACVAPKRLVTIPKAGHGVPTEVVAHN